MKQSTVIFGCLLFAFIMYITLRGQLPAYLALFKPKTSTTTNTGAGGSSTSSSSTSPLDAAKNALNNWGGDLTRNIFGSGGVDDSGSNSTGGIDVSFDGGNTWTTGVSGLPSAATAAAGETALTVLGF